MLINDNVRPEGGQSWYPLTHWKAIELSKHEIVWIAFGHSANWVISDTIQRLLSGYSTGRMHCRRVKNPFYMFKKTHNIFGKECITTDRESFTEIVPFTEDEKKMYEKSRIDFNKKMFQ